MSVPEAEIRRGAGGDPTAPPLPQGKATELNEALENIEEPEAVLGEEPEEGLEPEEGEDIDALIEVGDVFGEPDDAEEMEGPRNEDELIMTADGLDQQTYLEMIRKPKQLPPPPKNIGAWLPALAAAARQPNAPPGVVALYETIMDALYPPKAG